jgi:hypothetical protein
MHVPDGRQTIRLVVTDMWLNSEDSSVEFYVDTQPPEVWVEAPTNGTLTNGTSILVHGEVVGASRILADGITLQLDGEMFWGEVDLPQEGPNRVLIVAEDELANRALVELIIIRDTTPPRLTLTPLPSLVNYTMVEVIGWTDGGFLAIAPMNTSTMVEGDFRLTVELRPGPNTIRIVVSDAVGNIVNGSLECNVDTMVLFEVVSPKNGESVDGHEVILIGRTEPGMLLTVNGNAPMQWTVDDMTGDFNVTLELARYGLNTFLFTLEDPAGNTIVYHYSLNRQGMPNPTNESIHPAMYAILIVAVGAITVAGLLARRHRHG